MYLNINTSYKEHMKKGIKRKVLCLLVALSIIGNNGAKVVRGSNSIYVANEEVNPLASTTYAYSIGVNYGTGGSYTGDFTSNVTYAKNAYARLSNVTSVQLLQPTVSSIKMLNPNGNRILASKIVFLNGHSIPTKMTFNHNNQGGNYYTTVTSGNDGDEGAGLLSINMSTCKLISFIGCQTGNLNYSNNLVRTAVAQGAKVAVGFKTDIASRTTAGKGWLTKYNDALGSGKTVSESIRAAVDSYPGSNMSAQVILAGNPSNSVGTASVSTEVSSNVDYTDMSYTANINIDDLQDVVEDNIEKECYQNIVERLKEIDNEFLASDYKITINRYDVDSKDGVAILLYYIDGVVKTTKAYTCTIQNDVITEIRGINQDTSNVSVAMATRKTVLSETQISSLVQNHKVNEELNVKNIENKSNMTYEYDTSMLENCEIYNTYEEYLYDYATNTLIFEKVFYYINEEEGGVIGDYYQSEVLW